MSAPEQTWTDCPAVSRRSFLKGLAAGSLLLAGTAGGAVRRLTVSEAESFEPDLFVAIAPDGTVSILAHRSEMGTGIRTALPLVVSDEMGADWDRVVIRQAKGDKRLGSQNTDGSRSIRRFHQPMRISGATARTLLERAAAKSWGVSPSECRTANHEVLHDKSGRKADFRDLVAAASKLPVPKPDELKFKTTEEKVAPGREIAIVDLDDILTGKAKFGIDVRVGNQLFAVIERSPVLGGQVESVDDKAARAIPGVVAIETLAPFKAPHAFQALGGVAVLAETTAAAISARRRLKVKWTASDNAAYDSRSFAKTLADAARKPGKPWRSVGDAAGVLAGSDKSRVFEADYFLPHLAHAPMEPPCALANVKKNAAGTVTSIEVWAPTQNPQAAQGQLAGTFRIAPDKITVNVTLLGGGFGRKSKPDFIVEAALLSDRRNRPVHVTWTREDDIRHDYYHTVAAVHMRASLDEDGMPVAWLQRSAAPTISSTFAPGADEPSPLEMGLGFSDIPYDVPNIRVESGKAPAHVRIGWLRSVAHVYHAFGVCSFPDELAHRAGRDPYAYLMDLLGKDRHLDLKGVDYPNHKEPLDRYPFDVGRLRAVTERVAKSAKWGRKLPEGRGLGIACHRSFLSYCANVVEVEVTPDGKLTIPKVWVCIDAGTVVMPDRVAAQMEGAAVFGTSLALHGEITAKKGVIRQSNFHDYKMARIDEAPHAIDVDIVASEALPGGVGEVGVPPFAPALANAIFAATGKRVRELPIARHDLSWS